MRVDFNKIKIQLEKHKEILQKERDLIGKILYELEDSDFVCERAINALDEAVNSLNEIE